MLSSHVSIPVQLAGTAPASVWNVLKEPDFLSCPSMRSCTLWMTFKEMMRANEQDLISQAVWTAQVVLSAIRCQGRSAGCKLRPFAVGFILQVFPPIQLSRFTSIHYAAWTDLKTTNMDCQYLMATNTVYSPMDVTVAESVISLIS